MAQGLEVRSHCQLDKQSFMRLLKTEKLVCRGVPDLPFLGPGLLHGTLQRKVGPQLIDIGESVGYGTPMVP